MNATLMKNLAVEVQTDLAQQMLILLKGGLKRPRGGQQSTRYQKLRLRTLVGLGRRIKKEFIQDGLTATEARARAPAHVRTAPAVGACRRHELPSRRRATLRHALRHRVGCWVFAREGISRMLRKFAPRGDRSLGTSDDPEFRGWRANMQLMQALEQRRRISGCRCARATSTARAEQPSRSAGRTRPRLPLGQCEPRKGPVEIKRTKSGVFALRCPLPRPLEEKSSN